MKQEFVIASINRDNLLSKQKLETAFKMFDKVFFKKNTKNSKKLKKLKKLKKTQK